MYKCRGGQGWPGATDVHGCTSVAEARDGLERPFSASNCIGRVVIRGYCARYIVGEWDRGGAESAPSFFYTIGWNAVNASKSAALAPKP